MSCRRQLLSAELSRDCTTYYKVLLVDSLQNKLQTVTVNVDIQLNYVCPLLVLGNAV